MLDGLLASWGCRAGRDGEVLALGAAAGRRVLVLGGARSGKSAYAEGRVQGQVTYVATAPPRAGDGEWDARVAAHVLRRPPDWETVETGDVAGVLRTAPGTVLVDDLGLWLVRLLDDGGLARIGPLLTASHRSMRDDFRITVPEVDTAVDALLEAGALGARMTGGGFGGCVIGLVPEQSVEAAGDRVRRAFADAGFGEVQVREIESDPINFYYVATK